jgi:hypothetical protein
MLANTLYGVWMRRFATAAGVVLLAAGCGGAGNRPAEPLLRELQNPAAAGALAPHLARAPDGRVVLSWLEPSGDAYAFRYSVLGDGRWSEPQTLVEASNLFVNWADLPSVVPISADMWAAHWLVLQPDAYEAYDIVYTLSSDGGVHWSEPRPLNVDGTRAEHGFVTLFPWGADVGALWLDGRNEADFEFPEEGEEIPVVGTSLRFARLAPDGGARARGSIDELACDCCKTDVATTPAGPVVVYRDRSEQEIRDISVRRYDGQAWTDAVQPGRDGWEISGCPVNGPAAAARGDRLAVAWFTAADGAARVRFAWSQDAGASFGAPLTIDADGPDGQVDTAVLDGGDAVVTWWRAAADGGTALAARRIGPSGELGPVKIVGTSSAVQALDIPQMVRSGRGLVFAWTDTAGDGVLRTVYTENWP